MKGLISLDIDGTTTPDMHGIPQRTREFLKVLSDDGWRLAFITGRPYCMAAPTLADLTFPYYLAIQNGVTILDFPTKNVVSTTYLDQSTVRKTEEILSHENIEYVLYGGYHLQDQCFFRPHAFSPDMLHYLRNRMKVYGETWVEVDDFAAIQAFAAVKAFGDTVTMTRFARIMEEQLGLNAPRIEDPFDRSYDLVQATHPRADKGQAMATCYRLAGGTGPIIAAGDDLNDISMLAKADVRIAMETAPQNVLDLAHIVAPTAQEQGLIEGLKNALHTPM